MTLERPHSLEMTTIYQNTDPSTQWVFPRHQVFVVNTSGWLMSCAKEFCARVFCLAYWLCLTVLLPIFLILVSLRLIEATFHLQHFAVQQTHVFLNSKSNPDLKHLIFHSFSHQYLKPITLKWWIFNNLYNHFCLAGTVVWDTGLE